MGANASQEKLSRDDLEFLLNHTQFSEDQITEWYRGFKQDCPEGRLTPSAFLAIYSKCFPKINAKRFCEHVFRTFDTDKNGFIDFKEFLLAIDVTSSGSAEKKLSWAFRMYDVDGNGWIDILEMTKIVKSIYCMMGPQTESAEKRAKEIFRRMDRNSDGKVTRDEFVQSCLVDNKLCEMLNPQPSFFS